MAAKPIWGSKTTKNPAKKLALRSIVALSLGAALLLADVASVRADPPDWAPAWGYRDKHHKKHHKDHDYDDYDYYRPGTGDVGYLHCNGALVGGVVGAAAGGAIGGAIADGDSKTVGVIGGVILGAVLGGVIGNAVDQSDADCAGRAFAYGEPGQAVRWRNPERNVDYILVPTSDFRRSGRDCRSFVVEMQNGKKSHKQKGIACRGEDGAWRLDG